MRKPKAYITENRKNLDMSSASVYGDIECLYKDAPPNPFQISTHAYHIKHALRDAIGSDYLIVGGNMILLLIAFGVLYEKFGYVNLLLYDIRANQYVPRVLPKHQLTGGKDE